MGKFNYLINTLIEVALVRFGVGGKLRRWTRWYQGHGLDIHGGRGEGRDLKRGGNYLIKFFSKLDWKKFIQPSLLS
jgi:hypothetical protein